MKHKYFLILFSLVIHSLINVHAQTKPNRYMLCVGINNYSGDPKVSTFKTWDDREIKNLHGCLNDVDTISKLFQKYYQFDKVNIVKLLDQQASRNAIMDSLKAIANRCRKGDYFVFFYSGHGSYGSENTNQKTIKGYRNTIVPANAKDKNVFDIDNVEFNALFYNFVKKGVKLTVITDCCHSGTNTRGATLFDADSSREVESAPPHAGAFVENIHTIRLDSLGALTIGACQDNQESKEMTLESKAFGAFTISFCRAITEWPMASAENLYERTLAKIGLIRKEQNPNMEGSKRLNLDIIGSKEGEYRRQAFPLYRFDTTGYKEIKAGFLDGLLDGDILVEQKSKDSIRILAVLGPSNSSVEIINSTKKFKIANGFNAQFSVLNLVSNTEPPLKVFLGNSVSEEQVNRITAVAKELFQNRNINWVIPSVNTVPEAVLFYKADTALNGQWKLNRNKGNATKTYPDLKTDELISLLNKKNVYLQLPPENSLTKNITKRLAEKINRNIKIVNSAQQADYVLAGHLVDSSRIEYGWENTHLNDSTTDLPITTDFFSYTNETNKITDSLMNRLTILSKLAYWLSIETPIKDSSLRFPYSISIKNKTQKNKPDADRKNKMRADMTDLLEISFVEDKYTKMKWDNVRLFIYLFSMDPKGNMNLIYPQPRTSIFNYPWIKGDYFEPTYLATVKHTSPGKYHYFLLACKDPVINRSVFNQHGVKRSGEIVTSDNPLEILMSDSDADQRGAVRTFGNWLLKRVDIITEDKTVAKK